MLYRRLSYDLQSELGLTGMKGEDGFIGFYINARVIAEAFPWLPEREETKARNQVINFFHLKWIIEVLSWLRVEVTKKPDVNCNWLYDYFATIYNEAVIASRTPINLIDGIINCCTVELRESKLDANYDDVRIWNFVEYDFLESFFNEIQAHCAFAKGKTFFLFLDDYSTPLVTATTQRIINPIIFRRNSIAIFKISTESVESFERIGLNSKSLEEGADFKLIELGMFALSQQDGDNIDIVKAIFKKRIKRSSTFMNYDLSLDEFLSNETMSNNKRAYRMRENDRQSVYYGTDTFVSIWSSDIRELIKIFADMVSRQDEHIIKERLENGVSIGSPPLIPIEIQNRVFREAGGRFIDSLPMAMNPLRKPKESGDNKKYGEHLYDIVIAFQEIAYFTLKNKDSKSQEQILPKQARRIELTSANGELNEEARNYYRGLIRYGVFIQDYRAKSVRGTISTRLWIRSLLIPYCRITFSKRDCITLEWEDFSKFLLNPNSFKEEYKRKITEVDENQIPISGF